MVEDLRVWVWLVSIGVIGPVVLWFMSRIVSAAFFRSREEYEDRTRQRVEIWRNY